MRTYCCRRSSLEGGCSGGEAVGNAGRCAVAPFAQALSGFFFFKHYSKSGKGKPPLEKSDWLATIEQTRNVVRTMVRNNFFQKARLKALILLVAREGLELPTPGL
jgi:hypothetical protein